MCPRRRTRSALRIVWPDKQGDSIGSQLLACALTHAHCVQAITAGARQNIVATPGQILCCVKQLRYSHAVNIERVRDRDRAPLSITNKSRKWLILGSPREIRSKSVSSGGSHSSGSVEDPRAGA